MREREYLSNINDLHELRQRSCRERIRNLVTPYPRARIGIHLRAIEVVDLFCAGARNESWSLGMGRKV
jgi:hypothetical protein